MISGTSNTSLTSSPVIHTNTNAGTGTGINTVNRADDALTGQIQHSSHSNNSHNNNASIYSSSNNNSSTGNNSNSGNSSNSNNTNNVNCNSNISNMNSNRNSSITSAYYCVDDSNSFEDKADREGTDGYEGCYLSDSDDEQDPVFTEMKLKHHDSISRY